MAIIGTAGGRVFHRLTKSSLAAAATPVLDTTPDAFSFTDVTNAALSTVQTSNTITVTGIDATVTLTAAVTGDASSEMQVNGGAWGAGSVSVTLNDTIAVRHTSSALSTISVNTILTVGTVSDAFTSTTLGAPSTAGQPVGLLLALTKAS